MTGPDAIAPNRVTLTLWLQPARVETADIGSALRLGGTALHGRTYLSRAVLRRDHDADPAARSAVVDCFHAAGVTEIDHDWRRVLVRGVRAACEHAVAAVRASACAPAVVAIFGLEPTTPMHANAHAAKPGANPGRAIGDVAKAYRFPTGLNGHDQTIALIHLTGSFHAADLAAAMEAARLAIPTVKGDVATAARSADDLEIALDTQVIASVANGATLALYRAENDARGYTDAIARALLDAQNAASIISISYGVPEAAWPRDALRCIEQLFTAAALCGVTVVAASGDAGAVVIDDVPQVDYPASSPLVLACGGTDLRLEQGRRLSEHVWNEGDRSSGGGYSRSFDRTPWSSEPAAHGRGVPDVAAHAATANGYRIHLDSEVLHVGGTSAAAPLWTGFLATLNQRLGQSCGLVTPLLYARRSPPLFFDVTVGDNGRYRASAGWDPCTGLGAPYGDALLSYFTAAD